MIEINSLHTKTSGSCGYCAQIEKKKHPNRDWSTSGFVSKSMSLSDYKQLLDKGWRRCGDYFYKADTDQCCCRPYQIRIDTTKYLEKNKQRKTMIKVYNYMKRIQKEANTTANILKSVPSNLS